MRSGGPPLPPCGGGPFRSYPFMLQTCYARSGAKSRWTGFGKPSCKREASLLRKRGLSLQRERTQRFRRSSAGEEARGRVVLCREGASTNVVARRLAPLSVAGACRHRVRPENDACNEGPRAHAGKQRCESAKQLRLKQLKHCRCCAAVSHSEPMSAGSASVYELLQRMRRLARMAGEPVLRGTPGPGKPTPAALTPSSDSVCLYAREAFRRDLDQVTEIARVRAIAGARGPCRAGALMSWTRSPQSAEGKRALDLGSHLGKYVAAVARQRGNTRRGGQLCVPTWHGT